VDPGDEREVLSADAPDVFVIANHLHSELSLIDKGTAEPRLEGLYANNEWEPTDGN
jgi:hypothetical protein